MNKCPRCENEKLKEDYNYCPICGALLDYEIAEAASKILSTLLNNYKTYECEDVEEEKYRALVVGALGIGISELERTAQEVPVQEQSTDWIEKLAKELTTCLPTHDILSK